MKDSTQLLIAFILSFVGVLGILYVVSDTSMTFGVGAIGVALGMNLGRIAVNYERVGRQEERERPDSLFDSLAGKD